MTGQNVQILLTVLAILISLTVAGFFVRPGTYKSGIDVMEKVIKAYETAEKLDEEKQQALAAQVSETARERDSFKSQLETERRVFKELLEQAAEDAKREKEAWVKERALWTAEKAAFQAEITQLKRELATLRGQVQDIAAENAS